MDYLFNAKEHILRIKHNVENTDIYYSHSVFSNAPITAQAISIIMTASNRSKQTYFTLDRIAQSEIKDIQVIIVDDSDVDPLINERLETYPFQIDFIKINKSIKNWHNPLVNYNIGFKFITGSFIIIQNAEVCHIGDICNYVKSNARDNNYYIFDVKASLNFETNELIYKDTLTSTTIYNKNLFDVWYQSESNNRNYHFLTAMTAETFAKVKKFSYDCTVGACYDDDDFLLKIKSKNVNMVNVFHTNYNLGGIHLFHGLAGQIWDKNVPSNEVVFQYKKSVYNSTGKYVDIIER